VKNKVVATVLLAFSFAVQPVHAQARTGLSDLAKAWLSEHRVLVFSGQDANAPFEFIHPVTSEYSGLNIELIRWIATEFGFTATFMPLPVAEAKEALLEGRVDAITGIFNTQEQTTRFDYSIGIFPIPALTGVRGERNEIGYNHLAVASGDSILLSILDAGIKRARQTGTLETIYRKWTGTSLVGTGASQKAIHSAMYIVLAIIGLVSAVLIPLNMVQRRIHRKMDTERADLEKTVVSLREENERLAATNIKLRQEVEERSRLEEEKRRIDAEVAARRVEELTRCAIAAALESTQAGTGKAL
jgi:ABC-type amino acid transport substrate-binding protein